MAGANRSLYELVRALRGRYEISIVLTGEGAVADIYRQDGMRVVILPPGEALSRYGQVLAKMGVLSKAVAFLRSVVPYARRFARLLQEEHVDLVHANDMRGGLLIFLATKWAGVPLVGHVRGQHNVVRLLPFLYELATDRLVTVSEALRETLSGVGRRKAVTVHNGIGIMPAPTGKFPWIQAWREHGTVVVSYFASLIPFKGHGVLLDAAHELGKRGLRDRFMLLCVGDFVPEYGRYQDLLLRHAESLELRNVTFAGWQADPFGLYAVSDICVLVSTNSGRVELGGETIQLRGSEGFPRTILEAMLFAKPVIGTDNAGVCEQIVDGVTGRIVPPLNALRLADALEELILDPIKRERMGRAGRQRVREHFSTEAYRDGVCRVYDELLGSA
jgi:glycosyltransferase involved in cell wall biosynthesis